MRHKALRHKQGMTAIAAQVVEADLTCVGCGYNLRTQALGGVCPECGKSVQATLRFPHLARSAPRWLTSLVDSVTVLLVAFAVACSWFDRGRDEPLPVLLGTIAWALGWFAVWLLTRPEPGRPWAARRVRAWLLRVTATLPYATAFAVVPLVRWIGDPLGVFVAGALPLFVLPATFLYYAHLRDAALRLPNRRLAWQAAALAWLLPLAAVVSMAGVVALDRWPRSGGQIPTMLPMTGLGGIHDLWTTGQILRARASLLDSMPLTVLPAAVMTVWAVAVLVQFRVAFAAAVRSRQGHPPVASSTAGEPR
jgi:hypothetical protein